jgi:hypothetical protein
MALLLVGMVLIVPCRETPGHCRPQGRRRRRRGELAREVRNQKLGEVAEEFDRVHSVQRAKRVGSVDRIIPPAALRPYLVDAVERGMRRTLGRAARPRGAARRPPR